MNIEKASIATYLLVLKDFTIISNPEHYRYAFDTP